MGKESVGQRVVRYLLLSLIVLLLGMLYWSSTLQEESIRNMRITLEELNGSLSNIQNEIEKLQNVPFNDTKDAPSTIRKQIDPNLPNLLTEDPFYKTTLPKLLGPDFKPLGTLHTAVVSKPENLHPFSNWSEVIGWVNQCVVAVARSEFGRNETYAPDMAIKMEERKNEKTGKQEFWIHLRDGVFWQPLRRDWFPESVHLAPHFLKKHPVTAHDFKFYWDALMNPFMQQEGAVALRNYLGSIEEIEVIDDVTFIVRWKHENVKEADGRIVPKIQYIAKLWTGALRPLPRFVYQYFPDGTKIVEDDADKDTYRTNSVWAQNFSEHWAKNIIVSCGGWIFDGMTERLIRFKRNPNHFFPLDVLVEASEVVFKDSPDNIWTEFKANRIDYYEVRPDQLMELQSFLASPAYAEQKAQGAAINRLDFVSRAYAYIGWNEKRPFFTSKKVRQALTMAIDRKRIISQFLNGMGIEINGTFYRYSPAYDASIPLWPYDPMQARRMLQEEGWYDSTGTGTIDKMIDGKRQPFVFSLSYFVKNPTAKVIAEYVATALKEIGIIVDLNGVDLADLSAIFDDKNFDALTMGWGFSSPPEDPRQVWYSAGGKEKGSSNVISFDNKEADAIIDALQYEFDKQKRLELYHRFDEIIHEEAPYVFLYTPKTALLYRERVQNVFIPADRQDLVPGADVGQPDSGVFWLKQ